jgi:hypothetical protein
LAQPPIDWLTHFQRIGVEVDLIFNFFGDTQINQREKNVDSGADAAAGSGAVGGVAEPTAGLSTASVDSTPAELPFAAQRRNAIRSLATTQPLVAATIRPTVIADKAELKKRLNCLTI